MATDPPKPTRVEDEPRTLIFVDMLGFAAHTMRHQTRTLDSGPDEHGFLISGTTPLQGWVVRFQHVLDMLFRSQSMYGGVSAQVFSDCAYIDLGTSLRAARAAEDMMRDFIELEVPVRMGIGRGTFYAFKHSIETVDSHTVSKAMFAGTAVIYAHSAEQCGAKGCRILVHPSAAEDLRRAGHDTLMPMPAAVKGVSVELCYLPHDRMKEKKVMRRPHIVDQDVELVRHLRQIREDSEAPPEVLVHYIDTFAAIDRMRAKLHRGDSLEEAEARQDESDSKFFEAAERG